MGIHSSGAVQSVSLLSTWTEEIPTVQYKVETGLVAPFIEPFVSSPRQTQKVYSA